MKKNILKASAAALAALLFLPGCQREQFVSENAETGVKTQAIPLYFEGVDRLETRVDITGPDDANPGVGTWTPGDKVAIYIAGTGAGFYQIRTVENIGNPDESTGRVMVSTNAGQERANYAIYPASAAVTAHSSVSDPEGVWIRYPSEYDYSELTVAQMATYSPTPMVAENNEAAPGSSEVPVLNFYHVGGLLRVEIPDVPQGVRSVRFTFPEGMKFTGHFKVLNGGTTAATLEPIAGETYGNEITVKLPTIETGKADLTLNIPLPYGDYVLLSDNQNYTVTFSGEFNGRLIDYLRSTDAVHWRWILRAQGKAVTLNAPRSMGMMGGFYLSRGFLRRNYTNTVSQSDMTLAGDDEFLAHAYYGKSFGKMMFFFWTELGKIMTGDPDFDGSTSYENATIEIDGVNYRVPSNYAWEAMVNLPRPGSVVNGETVVKRYSKVAVNRNGSPLYTGTLNGLLIYPDGGVFDCDAITNFNTPNAAFQTITYDQYRMLCDGPTGCVFLPCAGFSNGSSWYGGGSEGSYWSSSWSSSSGAYSLFFNSGNVNPSYSNTKGYFFPVRLLQESN